MQGDELDPEDLAESPYYEDRLLWSSVNEVHMDWIDGEPPMGDEAIAFQLWRAEDKILSEFPHIEAWIQSGQVRASTVGRVAVGMAMRRLTNPRFQRSIQQGGGPYTATVTTGGDHPGEIYLSDDDRADLKPKKRNTGRRAYSVMPRF